MANKSVFYKKKVAPNLRVRLYLIWVICSFFFNYASAQDKKQNKPLVAYLNEDKSHFIKFSGYGQFWARYTQLNPGSKVNESLTKSTADLSLRRLRMKMIIYPIDNLTLVFQGGTTNLTYLNDNESAFDLLDAFGEYKFSGKLSLGAGRSNWKGLTRFASGPTATLLYDVPFLDLGNVNRTDLTLRNLNIFAKGQFGRLDYRVILAKPYVPLTAKPVQNVSGFNNLSAKPNLSAYLKWQFFEQESNAGPTSAGSYLGKKKVLAVGIGAELQKDLLWHLAGTDTVLNDMKLYSADAFFDTPINLQKGTSFNVYAAVFHHDYGPGYIRNLGINNISNGLDAATASFNGAGNSYPVVGTGNSLIFQTGFTLPYFNQQKKKARLMPAIAIQYSKFERLSNPMFTYDLGLSLLLRDHASKFVFNAQSRPIYRLQGTELKVSERKMMFVLMYHINID
ncbi:hypothetical protein ASU31_25080 [Pedobacter ginsenosidimutans]|uniref:Porin n=1 Tax=Pedobacter ginsenosidimutans TaxID=687842 RepID=A0A0T5VHQ1_9SPHI|nr:hypothetical protein [Pedobacter ginsenosidimutans]KRT13338.1 hypothetical protein ASU31_25080 [Pedobacter ginsenosidimutans]